MENDESNRMQSLSENPEALRERIENLYRHSQVGLCVNGIAHDINNLLGAIMGYAELVSMEENLSPDLARMSSDLMRAAEQASYHVENITTIARKPPTRPGVFKPERLVQCAMDLRNHPRRVKGIEDTIDIAEPLPEITGLFPQLQLALLYLLLNAEDNLANSETRRIEVKARGVNNGVEIIVADSGPELSPETAEQAFAPLVSGRDDHHLGLGLSVARETVEMHDGALDYQPGSGFRMYLPAQNGLTLEG